MSIMEVKSSQAKLFPLPHHGRTLEDLAWCSQTATGLQLDFLERIKSPLYESQSESLSHEISRIVGRVVTIYLLQKNTISLQTL